MARKSHTCPDCGDVFTSEKKRRTHQRYEHGTVQVGRPPTNGFAAKQHEFDERRKYKVQVARLGLEALPFPEWSKQFRERNYGVDYQLR